LSPRELALDLADDPHEPTTRNVVESVVARMSGKVLSGHSSELLKCGWRHVSALGAHHGRDALAGSPEEGRNLGIVWIGWSHLPNGLRLSCGA